MRLQVVDRDERTTERVGHPFGGVHAHDERTGEPRSLRDGNGVDLVAVDPCLAQCLLDDRDDGRDMASGGKLGNDTAVAFMDIELGGYDRGEDLASPGNYRGGGLIARCLDAEDDHDIGLFGWNSREAIRWFRRGGPGPGTASCSRAQGDLKDAARGRCAGSRPRRETA